MAIRIAATVTLALALAFTQASSAQVIRPLVGARSWPANSLAGLQAKLVVDSPIALTTKQSKAADKYQQYKKSLAEYQKRANLVATELHSKGVIALPAFQLGRNGKAQLENSSLPKPVLDRVGPAPTRAAPQATEVSMTLELTNVSAMPIKIYDPERCDDTLLNIQVTGPRAILYRTNGFFCATARYNSVMERPVIVIQPGATHHIRLKHLQVGNSYWSLADAGRYEVSVTLCDGETPVLGKRQSARAGRSISAKATVQVKADDKR